MLTIKAEGSAGMSLRDQMLPEMLVLAKVTNCAVEVKANETVFVVFPNDTCDSILSAYDRLYPDSRMVMSGMMKPWPREGVRSDGILERDR